MRELRLVPGLSHTDKLVFESVNTSSTDTPATESDSSDYSLPDYYFVTVSKEIREIFRPPIMPSRTQQNPTDLALSPRDIQTKLRQGASVADVAREAGVDPERIESFTTPIIQERKRIAQIAQLAFVHQECPKKLNQVIEEYCIKEHIEQDSLEWDAYKNQENKWVLSLHWPGKDSQEQALWLFSASRTSAGTLSALNENAQKITASAMPEPEPEDIPEEIEETPPVHENFNLHGPIEEPDNKKKRGRKASPHWEDVLLGVRSSTKRSRNREEK